MRDNIRCIEDAKARYQLSRIRDMYIDYNEGDAATVKKFIAGTKKNNRISKIKCKDGQMTENMDNILKEFHDFYENLYSIKDHNTIRQSEIIQNFDRNIPECFIDSLKKPFNETEVTEAICKLNVHSAPGPDGLTSMYYKMFSHLIAPALTRIFNNAANGSPLPPTFYQAVIKLLPKVKTPLTCGDYRPISLINTDQKIFSHVIANRCKGMLNVIIKKEQYAYLSNRNIHTAINFTKMVVDQLMDDTSVVALDFSKAFDRVDRNYMFELLTRIECPANMITAIKTIYSNTSAFVEVNGFLSPPITLKRGVRQGCPLSALLFILALEPLLDMIRNNPNIHSTSPRTVNAYADDVSAYIRHLSMDELFSTVDDFCSATQFEINKDKSEIMSTKSIPGYQHF